MSSKAIQKSSPSKKTDTSKTKVNEKKRVGPSETLPPAEKKVSPAPTSLFQVNSSWGAPSTAPPSAKASSNTTKSKATHPAPSAEASSSSNQAPRVSKFGFAPRPQESKVPAAVLLERLRPPPPAPLEPEEPVETPSESLLQRPTIDSHLPNRVLAEGKSSVKDALRAIISDKIPVSTKPMVVLDCANVSYEHGKGSFSTLGVPLAVKYFQKLGVDVVTFLPEHHLTQHWPDPLQDWKPLEDLVHQNILILTPGGDYDDLYIVECARERGAVVVSRDRYRDVPLLYPDSGSTRREVADWLRTHRMSFTFDGDKFVPSPGFKWQNHNIPRPQEVPQ